MLSDESLFDHKVFDDEFWNTMWEASLLTPGVPGVLEISLDEDTIAEVRAKWLETVHSLGDIAAWLVDDHEEFAPSDEFLSRIDKDCMKDFLQATEEEFKGAGIPEPPGGRHPFHDRLEELKERVERLK
ncbi:hypothetical protein CXU22_03425 [Akkermansia muciniphila]|uniref:Uncharacterized protein n=2 Tax=Akkermansia muciniphila TaxID=239935 RepID=A0A2N8HF20_9BACT|nr:hypothetical protein CXU22_03425 [Akkermansia muciniphila]